MLKTDVAIVGSGVSGLYCALSLPRDINIIIFTKDEAERCDSYLAQGGICVLKDESDYDTYFEDTMRAGHYVNDKKSVEIMIRSSPETIKELIDYGVEFERDENGNLRYTREGAHSTERILFHEDITGKEITSKLLAAVRKLDNVRIIEKFTMIDIVEKDNRCFGIIGVDENGEHIGAEAACTVFATGGIGGLYENSTNYRHLTGDAVAISLLHNIELLNVDYIQIHPTTFYSEKYGRRFLISESVRGEGALLYNHKGERFVNELLPRDVVSKAIFAEMEKENKPHEWLDMRPIGEKTILEHFPNIYEKCLKHGYDALKERIPVCPAQHYFMGGIKVDKSSRTTMDALYAVGETACNGVHGANRLASNSLLESLVFAKRAAKEIAETLVDLKDVCERECNVDFDAAANDEKYRDLDALKAKYKKMVLDEIEEERKRHE